MSTNEKMELMPVSNVLRAIVFIGFGLMSIIIGIVINPTLAGLLEGFKLEQMGSGLLDFNTFMAVDGNIGAPFVNSGLTLIFAMLSYLVTKTPINGGPIAAAYMVYGFSFSGKTVWNVWPLFFGVMIYALVNKKKVNTMTPLGWFSGALSPFVSIATFYIRMGGKANETIGETPAFSVLGFILAIVIGLLLGYMVALFASFLPDKHTGLTLYNAGFAAGFTGFLLFSFMKAIGLGHASSGPYHEFEAFADGTLIAAICALLVYLLICGLLITVREHGHIDTIVTTKYGGSAVEQFGFGATLVNMAICGFGCVLYWVLTITSTAHAPLFACLFTVVGFAANGITIRTMAPIMAGVYCMSFVATAIKALMIGAPVLETAMAYVGSKNMILAAMFGCGLSPVVYKHGPLVGFFTGMIHSLLVVNTGALHGWMSLYNNGFCSGIVATFFVPMILILLGRYQQEAK